MAGEGAVQRVLEKLAQVGSATASALRLKPDLLAELTAAELVVARPGKRGSVMVEITLAGRQELDVWQKHAAEEAAAAAAASAHPADPSAPPPTKARTPRARSSAAGSEERLARIEGLLEQILARLGPPPSAIPTVPERPMGEVKSILLDKIASLDSERRYGGLVPIPELRRALARDAGAHDIGDAQVTAALESLEQDYAIDLNIAQQPTAVPAGDRLAGIERPGRGLLYYVARRAP